MRKGKIQLKVPSTLTKYFKYKFRDSGAEEKRKFYILSQESTFIYFREVIAFIKSAQNGQLMKKEDNSPTE
jgi:hypothetical protein